MTEQPNMFAGVSAALASLPDQITALVRTGVVEATRRMDMVKREEFDALAARVAALEAKPSNIVEPQASPGGTMDA
jgi:BMFP domain-containing protein YqiC